MVRPIASQTDASGLPPTGRPVIYGTQGVISSGHYLTSMAGMGMLLGGGNAFDALVAAGFAAAVTEPIASYSLAAESVFMLYDAESGDLLSLSGQGTAPRQATLEFYGNQGLKEIPTGPGPLAHLSFTVPGAVDGYLSLLERYGNLPLSQVLEPAIHLAQAGFPHYEYMIDALDSQATRDQFNQYPPGGNEIFFQDGKLPRPGSILVQPGLARTLRRLAAGDAGGSRDRIEGIRTARRDFYQGALARTLVECARSVGGILSAEDLAGYRAQFEEPARTRYRGYEICCQRTWSQAPVLLQALNLLEHFDLRAMGHNSPAYVHTVVEALKLAIADREAFYGDPDFARVPLDGLLSKEYAAERVRHVDPGKAHPDTPPPGNPWKHSREPLERPAPEAPPPSDLPGPTYADQGTTHIAVVDHHGNLVCATPSGASFGKAVFFPEVGCALSTRSEMFFLKPDHPNRLEPGKRPRTTLVGYLVVKDGQPVMTVGCPGGDQQAQANLQLLLNVLVFGMNLQEAIEAPRFGSDSFRNSFYPHVYFPGQLSLEEAFPESTRRELGKLGHKVVPALVCGMGATITWRDPSTGTLATGADPRRSCYALGW
ncbi:MAG: gamma-glutamyltransferase family protein [Candidatus Aminicenantes bacterium]|nr:gamma-glutamyltransferase family protein [Candidatus Aminicenantes bacterium]